MSASTPRKFHVSRNVYSPPKVDSVLPAFDLRAAKTDEPSKRLLDFLIVILFLCQLVVIAYGMSFHTKFLILAGLSTMVYLGYQISHNER